MMNPQFECNRAPLIVLSCTESKARSEERREEHEEHDEIKKGKEEYNIL